MTKDEAMQMALDALKKINNWDTATEGNFAVDVPEVIEALRTALAQLELAPVYLIWFGSDHNGGWCETDKYKYDRFEEDERRILYTAPQKKEWVGLTKGETDAAYEEMGLNYSYVDFACAIEAKLKEKNHG